MVDFMISLMWFEPMCDKALEFHNGDWTTRLIICSAFLLFFIIGKIHACLSYYNMR